MAKIKNSNVPNFFGEGQEQEVTLDNGEKYIIRNSNVPNFFGGGYQKEIVKAPDYSEFGISGVFICLAGMSALVALISFIAGNVKWIIISLIAAILFLYLTFYVPSRNAKAALKVTALIAGIFAGIILILAIIIGVFLLWVVNIS